MAFRDLFHLRRSIVVSSTFPAESLMTLVAFKAPNPQMPQTLNAKSLYNLAKPAGTADQPGALDCSNIYVCGSEDDHRSSMASMAMQLLRISSSED